MNKPAGKLNAPEIPLKELNSGISGVRDQKSKPVIIKKYANRRLYNTETSSYVTLEDLGQMVRSERDFLVYDAKTAEDLTHTVLTQIIVEEEGKGGQNLLPIGFLRQLIRFYGHSIEHLVPQYLEFSLETLTREQERYRKQFENTFSSTAFEAIQEQAKQNMAMFERAVSMFAPFAKIDTAAGKNHTASAAIATAGGTKMPGHEAAKANAQPSMDDIAELKSQLAAMQAQLDRLSKSE
jgi:polyhydroxyalkanoate synthesis repressor PhaR